MTPSEIAHLQKKFFNPADSAIDRIDDYIDKLVGFRLTDEEIIGLSGAPTGSYVTVQKTDGFVLAPNPGDPESKREVIPSGALIKVHNPVFIMDEVKNENFVVLYTIKDAPEGSERGIYIGSVMTKKDAKCAGFAALMVRSMLEAARSIEGHPHLFAEIRLMAAGGRSWGDIPGHPAGSRWIGYLIWPEIGFDMPVPQMTIDVIHHFEKQPIGLRDCVTVRDVLGLPRGSMFWAIVGDGWEMTFDLRLGNRCEPKLSAYLGRVTQ